MESPWGAIASFVQLSKSYSAQLNQVSQQINAVIMALAGAERIFELMDEEIEQDAGHISLVNIEMIDDKIVERASYTGSWAWKDVLPNGTSEYTKLSGNINISGVDFSYNGKNSILHDINIFACSGEKIALVGATGAGKTTIANLLNGFYDVQTGKISYDGIDMTKI